jgi:hypothetical protein
VEGVLVLTSVDIPQFLVLLTKFFATARTTAILSKKPEVTRRGKEAKSFLIFASLLRPFA